MKKIIFMLFLCVPVSLVLFFLTNRIITPVQAQCTGNENITLSVSPTSGTNTTEFVVTVNWPTSCTPGNNSFEQEGALIAAFRTSNLNAPVTSPITAQVDKAEYKLPTIIVSEANDLIVKVYNRDRDFSTNNPTFRITSASEATGEYLQAGQGCDPGLQGGNNPVEYRCEAGTTCNETSKVCEGVSVDTTDSDGYSLTLSYDLINEKRDKIVRASISGLKEGKDYRVCHVEDESRCYRSIIGSAASQGAVGVDLTEDMFTDIEKNGNTASFDICGDGEDRVKIGKCDPSNDYFHGGNTYGILLFESNGATALAGDSFKVTRYYPSITINGDQVVVESNTERSNDNDPENIVLDNSIIKPVPNFSRDSFEIGESLKVQILGSRPRDSKKERNDYQVVLEAQNYKYKEEDCDTVLTPGGGYTTFGTFGAESDDKIKTLGQGTYLLKINDRVNANGTFRRNDCQGGFTYYHILFDLENATDSAGLTMRIRNIIVDPNNTDIMGLAEESESRSTSPLPCEKYDPETETCLEINLPVFGVIGTKPIEFVKTLGQRLLGIASVAAFVVIIYAGYQIMTSRGDKEKISQAREIITSAVTGLIFIILSIAILEIIGIDILRIPGFSR